MEGHACHIWKGHHYTFSFPVTIVYSNGNLNAPTLVTNSDTVLDYLTLILETLQIVLSCERK